MTTGDVVYSLRFSLIKILPGPGFDLGSTAGESCVLTARLHMLYAGARMVPDSAGMMSYKQYSIISIISKLHEHTAFLSEVFQCIYFDFKWTIAKMSLIIEIFLSKVVRDNEKKTCSDLLTICLIFSEKL